MPEVRPDPTTLEETLSHVSRVIQECEDHSDFQKTDRDQALQYYDGKMYDLPPEKNRSSAMSKDVRGAVRKLIPSVMRTLLGNDRIVEYHPISEQDTEQCEQATEYVNSVVIPESSVEDALHDCIFDAMVVKTGILTWGAFKDKQVAHYHYTDQSTQEMEAIASDEGVEIMDLESVEETDPEIIAQLQQEQQQMMMEQQEQQQQMMMEQQQQMPQQEQEQQMMEQQEQMPQQPQMPEIDLMRHSFTARRTSEGTDIRMKAVPRGSFLINPDAKSIEDALAVGERCYETRSELVAQGYDRDKVGSLSAYSAPITGDDEIGDRQAREGEDYTSNSHDHERTKSTEEVLVYRMYIRMDLDDDGVAELHYLVLAEGADNRDQISPAAGGTPDLRYVVLQHDLVEQAPYAKVVIEREAHQFEGHSLTEDTYDVQRIKTALLRSSLDNIYWQNELAPYVDMSKVQNPEAVMNPEFGKPVQMMPGANPKEAVYYQEIPFVAKEVYGMLGYMDDLIQDRTGIADRQASLDPEAFQNISATTAALMNESGMSQVYSMMRQLSRGGLKKAFTGLLGLVIAHAEDSRTVQIQGKWVTFDPRQWDSNMTCEINIGLGTASRESDLNVLQMIFSIQRDFIRELGINNPICDLTKIYYTLERMVEVAGLPSASLYFQRPTPAQLQQIEQQQQEQNPEAMKAQAEATKEEAKGRAAVELEQMKQNGAVQIEQVKAELAKEMAVLQVQATQQTEAMKSEAQSAVEASQMMADKETARFDAQLKMETTIEIARMEGVEKEKDRQLKREIAQSTERVDLAKIAAQAEQADRVATLKENEPKSEAT